jgi:hypothetical protein
MESSQFSQYSSTVCFISFTCVFMSVVFYNDFKQNNFHFQASLTLYDSLNVISVYKTFTLWKCNSLLCSQHDGCYSYLLPYSSWPLVPYGDNNLLPVGYPQDVTYQWYTTLSSLYLDLHNHSIMSLCVYCLLMVSTTELPRTKNSADNLEIQSHVLHVKWCSVCVALIHESFQQNTHTMYKWGTPV